MRLFALHLAFGEKYTDIASSSGPLELEQCRGQENFEPFSFLGGRVHLTLNLERSETTDTVGEISKGRRQRDISFYSCRTLGSSSPSL